MPAAPIPGLVSVIIPAYNAAPFLGQAIASACAQTHQQIEIIVINDGSTDATPAVIAQCAAAESRVVPIHLAERRGVAAARNAGLARAQGEWVALLDADDAFQPGRIAALLAAAARHGADLIADNLELRDFATGAPNGLAFPAAWMSGATDITVRTFLERDVAGLYRREMAYIKPLIKRSLLVEHDISYREDITAAEDLLFYITCLRAGGRLRLVPDALYIYALRPGSISSSGAANLGCLRVNGLLQNLYRGQDTAIADLLALRDAAIRFELLLWHLRGRRWFATLDTARRIPPGFLAGKLARAAMRRLGLPAIHPAVRALERIGRRHG